MQQTRLIVGVGYPLALRINAFTHARLPSADSKIVIEQASSFINRTTPDRFAAAQTMLGKALADHPDDSTSGPRWPLICCEAFRWFGILRRRRSAPNSARSLLKSVLKSEPDYIPGLQAYCRFLITTNHFAESLVACEKALSFGYWTAPRLPSRHGAITTRSV
ncbi:MAG: hypothetical protein J0G95_11755 [Rhizobiales bacterium]|nr:hypothetical protein [Hyphomicrobiales bacterium]